MNGVTLLGAAAAAMIMVFGLPASAGQATPAGAPPAAQVGAGGGDDGYGYEFKDDLLQAEGVGSNAAIIKVRRGAIRRTLIRPRTHFIPEMLKSVERI